MEDCDVNNTFLFEINSPIFRPESNKQIVDQNWMPARSKYSLSLKYLFISNSRLEVTSVKELDFDWLYSLYICHNTAFLRGLVYIFYSQAQHCIVWQIWVWEIILPKSDW